VAMENGINPLLVSSVNFPRFKHYSHFKYWGKKLLKSCCLNCWKIERMSAKTFARKLENVLLSKLENT
jgi:hypothetical protein